MLPGDSFELGNSPGVSRSKREETPPPPFAIDISKTRNPLNGGELTTLAKALWGVAVLGWLHFPSDCGEKFMAQLFSPMLREVDII